MTTRGLIDSATEEHHESRTSMTQFGFDVIHVFESLPERDGTPGKELTDRWNTKRLNGIECHYHFIFDKADLDNALDLVLTDARHEVPVLHFEVHGNDEGFGLRDNSFVRWDEFGAQLWPINRASDFHLLVVWSCCFGIHQISAMSAFQPSPFDAVLGCDQPAKTAELLAAFSAFYPTLVSTGKGSLALDALQSKITSKTKFRLFTAAQAFRGAYQLVREKNLDAQGFPEQRRRILSKLEHEAQQRGLPFPAVTDEQILDALRIVERPTLQRFYDAFFATAELPANRDRFPLDKLIKGL
jgi:hypothetical protein